MRAVQLSIVVLGVQLVAGRAVAGPNGRERELVVNLVTRSASHYEAGRFEEAIKLLEQAYIIEKSPTILYNLGRAREGLGDFEAAIQAYRAYLDAAPKAEDRGAIEQRIAVIRQSAERTRQLEEHAAAAREAEARSQKEARLLEETRHARQNASTLALPSHSQREPSIVPWAIAGVGVATLVGGLALGFRARALHVQAKNDVLASDAQASNDSAQSFAVLANVCFAAGGALTLTGFGLAVLDGGRSTPNGGVLLFRSRF